MNNVDRSMQVRKFVEDAGKGKAKLIQTYLNDLAPHVLNQKMSGRTKAEEVSKSNQ